VGVVLGRRPLGLRRQGGVDLRDARYGGAEDHRPGDEGTAPPDTVYTAIAGGNHEQMGWYTGQPNDAPATISRADQQAGVVAATVDLLGRIAPTTSLGTP